MSFPFYIARRYLFSKKSHNAINIISAISVGGVAVATMALVCVLSGFNGFRDLIGDLFTAFDPQLEVVPAKGKVCAADDSLLDQIRKHPDVATCTNCFEENGLILFRGRPTVIKLKGVDDNFRKTSDISDILYGEGAYVLQQADIFYGIPSYGLAVQMGGPDFKQLEICVPKQGEKINLSNPIENINAANIHSSGLCFQVKQAKYDNNYMLCSLLFAQQLYEQENCITQLELRLRPGADEERTKAALQAICGDRFRVLDRYEQQEETFNVMKIEKMFAFGFLAFIALVACFNIIGCLSMLIIEKRDDVRTLRNLGASDHTIVRIFLLEGRMITLFGAVIGVVLGLILCLLQQQFGWLKLGGAEGAFIIDAYPVSVHLTDIILVFFTVVAVGFLSVWYPVRYLSRRLL